MRERKITLRTSNYYFSVLRALEEKTAYIQISSRCRKTIYYSSFNEIDLYYEFPVKKTKPKTARKKSEIRESSSSFLFENFTKCFLQSKKINRCLSRKRVSLLLFRFFFSFLFYYYFFSIAAKLFRSFLVGVSIHIVFVQCRIT